MLGICIYIVLSSTPFCDPTIREAKKTDMGNYRLRKLYKKENKILTKEVQDKIKTVQLFMKNNKARIFKRKLSSTHTMQKMCGFYDLRYHQKIQRIWRHLCTSVIKLMTSDPSRWNTLKNHHGFITKDITTLALEQALKKKKHSQ